MIHLTLKFENHGCFPSHFAWMSFIVDDITSNFYQFTDLFIREIEKLREEGRFNRKTLEKINVFKTIFVHSNLSTFLYFV